ncbi:MAG: amino acid permease [Candidatus Marsarchaeota archaeon]|nr:amino acid permease [Candidatus Marsarchaeota archaeon]
MLGISSSAWPIAFAMLIIFVLSAINLSGLKKATKVDKWLVIAKIAVLALFVVFAVFLIFKSGKFPMQNFTAGHDGAGISAIFASSVVILFAYSGFQTISSFTSKVDGGPKKAAKAILVSVILSMIIYVLVVFTMLLLMPPKFYGLSADPISLALKNALAPPWLIYAVDIGALIATVSATLAMLIRSSRLVFQVSSDKLLPKIARSFNKQKDVAVNGTIISALISMAMLFAGNIYVIASISMFGILFAYLISSFSLIHFRRLKIYGEFRMPYYPYLTLVAISLILLFMFGIPKNVLSISIISILLLFIVYYFLRESKEKKPVRVELFK